MKILKRTLLTSLCVSMATGTALAQQNQQQNRQQQSEQRDQRERQNQSQNRDDDDSQSGRQSRQSRNQSSQRDSDGQPQYRVSPTGWIRVAADYDNDGRFDAIETMYVYDLERARQSSRQRANQDSRNQSSRNQDSRNQSSRNQYSNRQDSDQWQDSNQWQQDSRSEGMQRMRGDSRISQRMRQTGNTRTYTQQRQTVKGEIVNLETQNLAGTDGKSLMARIETEQGRTARVCLGPQQQLNRLDLSEGDQVTIEGVRGRVNDRSILLAKKVMSNGQSVNIEMPDSRQVKRVRGELLSRRNAKFRNQDEQHVLAKVRLISGKEETVNLGPKSKVEQLDLQQGDDVSLLVRPGRVNGERALIAEQVSTGDDSIEVTSNQRLTGQRGSRQSQMNRQEGRLQSRQDARQQYSQRRSSQRESSQSQDSQMSGQAALGIAVSDSENGVQVEAIYPNSPAQQSQLREGDEIVSIGGESIDSARQVIQKIQERSPNERLEIETQRNGQRQTITVRLADRSELTGSNNRNQSNR